MSSSGRPATAPAAAGASSSTATTTAEGLPTHTNDGEPIIDVDVSKLMPARAGTAGLGDAEAAPRKDPFADPTDIVGTLSLDKSHVERLPATVYKRVTALRKLHDKRDEWYRKYLEEKIALEKKYDAIYEPLYTQRAEIIAGRVDATAESDGDDEKDGEAVGADGAGEGGVGSGGGDASEKPKRKVAGPYEDEIVGVPGFWLQAMKNNEVLSQLITDRDEEALAFLTDVRAEEVDSYKGFRVVFHFEPNPYFSNSELSKTYGIPNMYEQAEPILSRADGTKINWKKGKNLTQRIVKRKQKRGRKGPKMVTRAEPTDSFFTFFNSPTLDGEGSDEEADEEELFNQIDADFEIALTLKDRVVPNAYAWYTGEAVDIDSDVDEDELEESSDDGAREMDSAEESSGDDGEVDSAEVRAALARAFKQRGGKLPAGIKDPPPFAPEEAAAGRPLRGSAVPPAEAPGASAAGATSAAPGAAATTGTAGEEGVVEKPGDCQQQ